MKLGLLTLTLLTLTSSLKHSSIIQEIFNVTGSVFPLIDKPYLFSVHLFFALAQNTVKLISPIFLNGKW